MSRTDACCQHPYTHNGRGTHARLKVIGLKRTHLVGDGVVGGRGLGAGGQRELLAELGVGEVRVLLEVLGSESAGSEGKGSWHCETQERVKPGGLPSLPLFSSTTALECTHEDNLELARVVSILDELDVREVREGLLVAGRRHGLGNVRVRELV
jgi:hypothetical protein